MLSFDVEATGVNVGTSVPYGFSLACNTVGAYYAPVENVFFKELLAHESVLKIAHNAPYDRSMMKKAGLEINNLCDTMVAAHLLGEEGLSLKSLMLKYFGIDVVSFSELRKKFASMDLYEMAEYSGPHSVSALMLWQVFAEKMRKLKLLDVFWNIEMPLVPVLSDIELNGVAVDKQVLDDIGTEIDGKLASIAEGLDYWSGRPGMNHNSPDQVADLLYKRFSLPPGQPTKSRSRPSVGAKYLETLKGRHSYIGLYLFYKQLETLKNSYIDSLGVQILNGRVYGSFNQTGTRTSRLSSSNPNLQKIPVRTALGKRIRTAFIAPEGHTLIKADADLLELKMIAHCSQAQSMLQAFRDGRDIHTETAIELYGGPEFRSKGKTADFQIIYQGGDKKTRAALEKAYPEIFAWTRRTNLQAMEAGYVRTIGGRIRVISELDSMYSKIQEHGQREAISTIVQGSSAEVIKIGMVKVWKKLHNTDAKMVLQVHDEVVMEVPDDQVPYVAKVLKEEMLYEELSLPITVTVSTGKNWGQMSKWE